MNMGMLRRDRRAGTTANGCPRREITLVVAGHTNVGKTSLLRTLGRTTLFGDVSPSPSTTQQVQPLTLAETADLTVTAYDTPGLESAGRLRELLEDASRGRNDRPAVIRGLLEHEWVRREFDQELRVLERAMEVDACLYVIDSREPVLEKYLDEIIILSMCGRPVLPLLNFTDREDGREREWRDQLARVGQHNVIAFDAVVYSWESELRLYRSLCSLLPMAEDALDDLIRVRADETDWRLRAAVWALADALIDLAACEDTAPHDDARALASVVERIQAFTREREARLGGDIVKAFNYSPELFGRDLHADYEQGGWQHDPFSGEALRYYGIRSMGPVATGATAGGTLEIAAAGSTVGAGIAIGAVAGLVVGARSAVRRAHRKFLRRRETVCVDDAVLRLVATRNLQLIESLQRRGHGSPSQALSHDPAAKDRLRGMLPRPIHDARDNGAWSAYCPSDGLTRQGDSVARDNAVDRLREKLMRALPSDGGSVVASR